MKKLNKQSDEFKDWKVTEVLLSGNEKLINQWKHEQSVLRTRERRSEMLGE